MQVTVKQNTIIMSSYFATGSQLTVQLNYIIDDYISVFYELKHKYKCLALPVNLENAICYMSACHKRFLIYPCLRCVKHLYSDWNPYEARELMKQTVSTETVT